MPDDTNNISEICLKVVCPRVCAEPINTVPSFNQITDFLVTKSTCKYLRQNYVPFILLLFANRNKTQLQI